MPTVDQIRTTLFRVAPEFSTDNVTDLATIDAFIDDSIIEVSGDDYLNPVKAYALWTAYNLKLANFKITGSVASTIESSSSISSVKRIESGDYKIEYEDKKIQEMIKLGKYDHPENIYGVWFDQLEMVSYDRVDLPFIM